MVNVIPEVIHGIMAHLFVWKPTFLFSGHVDLKVFIRCDRTMEFSFGTFLWNHTVLEKGSNPLEFYRQQDSIQGYKPLPFMM